MIVKIQVTADDIAKGHANDGCYCPIARAAQRAISSLPYPVIGRWDFFADAEDNVGAPLPGPAVEFIEQFDNLRDVAPFEFDLDVPDDLLPDGGA